MHEPSGDDRDFRRRFEACEIATGDFDHRAHVRLAYVYLCESDADGAYQHMRDALLRFLACNGIDPAKYHETLTQAWIKAVRHFMARTTTCESAGSFIERNPELLDSKIMLTHYSAALLFSPEARASFVDPDLDPIPDHTN